jgi:prepilin-type N-terminal cleavage/methylation domain-containing protein
MKEKKNYNQVGFTLIEIIVTMAIIVVVFSIAVSRSNRMSSRSNVTLTAEVMISDLRSTAMSALGSEQFQLQSPTGWGSKLNLILRLLAILCLLI